jgi:hypothetical protein
VVLPLVTYAWWTFRLYQITGRWDATAYAQRTIWNREVVPPWVGFINTIDAFDGPLGHVMARELVATLLVLAITIVIGLRRMWPELAFAGSACLVLMCSSLWGSSIRALTVLFPLWMFVGLMCQRVARRRDGSSWIAVALVLCGLGLFWCELLIANGVVVI